jgi:hypothetical protein
MPDRLAELRRQRALIQAHLAWLDREIEAVSGKENPTLSRAASPQTQSPVVAAAIVAAALKAQSPTSALAPAPESSELATSADAILDEYRIPPDTLKTDVRKGCFLYFALAFVVVGIVVTLLYFVLRRN